MCLYVAAIHGSNEQGEYCSSGSASNRDINYLLYFRELHGDGVDGNTAVMGLDFMTATTVTAGMGTAVTDHGSTTVAVAELTVDKDGLLFIHRLK